MLQAWRARAWDVGATDEAWRPLYVVAETNPVGPGDGPAGMGGARTTGYNYLNDLNGLFVNGAHAGACGGASCKAHRAHRAFDTWCMRASG